MRLTLPTNTFRIIVRDDSSRRSKSFTVYGDGKSNELMEVFKTARRSFEELEADSSHVQDSFRNPERAHQVGASDVPVVGVDAPHGQLSTSTSVDAPDAGLSASVRKNVKPAQP